MSFSIEPWLAVAFPKIPVRIPLRQDLLAVSSRQKQRPYAVCRSGARAWGSQAAPLLVLSRIGCSNPLQRRPQINSSPQPKSHPQRACYRTPGRASVQEPVNNLILNFWASGLLLLFNSRGRPRRTRALRALIVSAIPTRCRRPRRWDGPGIGSGAFPRHRSRDPFPPRSHHPTANHKYGEPSNPLNARRQNENSFTTALARRGYPNGLNRRALIPPELFMGRATDSSALKYSKTFPSAASATVRGLLSTV